ESGAANSEEKTQQPPVFGVVRNTSPGAIQTESAKKKPQSLFERLTGMRRSFSSEKKEEFVLQQPKVQTGAQEEDLEIPAFLRKNN
ncbi:MAG: hypothetical protein LBO73_01805, partial [Holosporaceae bacterium]|nr:hypothetical protein [Holosporaceae bacterium]